MGYSNFKSLRQTLEKFDIEEINRNLFPQTEEVQPSSWLVQALEYARKMPLTNEKANLNV